MSTPKVTVASLATLLEQMDQRIATELAAQHEALRAEIEALRAENEVLKSRITALEERPAASAPKQQRPAPVPQDPNQVTWEGTSRAGTPCRRIGKGDKSYLEDFVDGAWKRRANPQFRPVPPVDSYPDYYFA